MVVIPPRKKKKLIHCFSLYPFLFPLRLWAVILLLHLLLLLFYGSRCGCVVHFDPFSSFAHTGADNGLCHTDATPAAGKRQAVFFFLFLFNGLPRRSGVCACVSACALARDRLRTCSRACWWARHGGDCFFFFLPASSFFLVQSLNHTEADKKVCTSKKPSSGILFSGGVKKKAARNVQMKWKLF